MGSEIFWRTKPYIYHEIEKTTITSSTEEENIQIENPTTTPVTDAGIKNQIVNACTIPTSDGGK